MITLRNYPKLGSYVLINNNDFLIEDVEDRYKEIHGVGGISEKGDVVGIYVIESTLYFFCNGQSFEAPIESLVCTNNYISKLERRFRVTIGEKEICDIVYEPFIDPGMIYYDADPEEFDVLLYISGLLKDEESIRSFINGIRYRNNSGNNS